MKKSKRNFKLKKRLTRKHGGKKNNASLLITQMGGQLAPAPAPTDGVVAGLNIASVVDSMNTFGNIVYKLRQAANSSFNSADQHVTTSDAGITAATSMSNAAVSLSNAYFGVEGRTIGLYHSLVNAPLYLPPSNPAAAP